MSERFARMMERGLTGLVAAGVAAVLLVAGSAAAQARPLSPPQVGETTDESLAPAQRDQLFPTQRGGGVSLAQATAMAQRRFPGRVVRAEPVQMGDRVVYEIRILDAEGVVRNVRIDAQTGSFL
jgi:uncharacterized membrane protein YkoI